MQTIWNIIIKLVKIITLSTIMITAMNVVAAPIISNGDLEQVATNGVSFTTIEDVFNSSKTKWVQQGTIAPAEFINNSTQVGYKFTSDFSKVKTRCIWDVTNLNIDVSQKSFISFDIDITVPDAIRSLTVYLCFSGNWIYQPIQAIEGRQKIIINLNSKEFAKLKKLPVTAIRVSPWKSNDNIAKITISNVKSGSDKMLVVPNKVWYKKEEKVVSQKDFNLSTIKNLKFKSYTTDTHLFLKGKPVKLILHNEFLKIPKDISIECNDYIIDASLKEFIKKYVTSSAGTDKIKINCKIDPTLSVPGKMTDENIKRFQSEEAYYLNINTNSIILTGKSHLGILRGLASIALISSSQKSKKEPVINCAEIWQAPSIKARIYEGGSSQPTMKKRRDIVDLLYLLGYNANVVQMLGDADSGTQFPFDSLPKDMRANSSTKEEWEELNQYYESRGIELIPKIFSFARAGIILSRPEYSHLTETEGLNTDNHKKDRDNQNFCSSNPESYKLVFGLFDELINTFHPRKIHIALDEVLLGNLTCTTHCPPTKQKADWLKDVVLKTHEFLKSKGVTTLIYGDMLDPYYNGYQIGINNWDFVNNLPKDIIIDDWNYDIRDEYPSISKFTHLGFRTLGAPWDEPENWFGFIKQITKDDAYGLCGKSWGSIYPTTAYHSRAATLSLGATLCWAPPLKNMAQIPVQPVSKIYKQICYRDKMELPYAKNIKHISINDHILTDDKLAEAMNFPMVYDFNSIISGTKNYRGVSFHSFTNKTKMSAMVLFPKTTPVKIKIAEKAKHITFLHGTKRLDDISGNILYQKYNKFYACKYIIKYDDGKTEKIKMEFLKQITGWNSRMLASFVETGIFGTIGNEIHLNIPSYTWINPFPDKLIQEIDVISGNKNNTAFILYGLSIDN